MIRKIVLRIILVAAYAIYTIGYVAGRFTNWIRAGFYNGRDGDYGDSFYQEKT